MLRTAVCKRKGISYSPDIIYSTSGLPRENCWQGCTAILGSLALHVVAYGAFLKATLNFVQECGGGAPQRYSPPKDGSCRGTLTVHRETEEPEDTGVCHITKACVD